MLPFCCPPSNTDFFSQVAHDDRKRPKLRRTYLGDTFKRLLMARPCESSFFFMEFPMSLYMCDEAWLPPPPLQNVPGFGSAQLSHGSQCPSLRVPSASPADCQRLRKKENLEHIQIRELQQQIAEVKERLALSQQRPMYKIQTLAEDCTEMKKRATDLNRQLAEHYHWMQQLTSLMETAPLVDFNEDVRANQVSIQAPRNQHVLLDERLRTAVKTSQQHASKLLEDAITNAPSFRLPLQLESRGWKIATGRLQHNKWGFRCHRCLSAGPNNLDRQVAMVLFSSIQSDDVFCAFIPLVPSSMITHREVDCSLSCRVMQLSPDRGKQPAASVESIYSERDATGQEIAWQISLEAVHDHYLCSFVAESAKDFAIPPSAPPIQLDLGLQMSKLNMHNEFVLGARVQQTDEGVEILVVGSARFAFSQCHDPVFDLLRYFVSYLPAYESIHLSPLYEHLGNDK